MHISINSAFPIEAPHRAPWRTAEGTTRTDPLQYTADAAFMALGNAVVVDDPPAVADHQILGWNGSDWTVTDKPLADVRAARKDAVSAKRWAVETADIEVATVTYPGSREDAKLLDQAIADATAAGSPIDFRAKSGWISATAVALQAVRDAYGARRQAARSNERTLHDAIDGAVDVAAVLAVDIEAGWPA